MKESIEAACWSVVLAVVFTMLFVYAIDYAIPYEMAKAGGTP